MLSARVFRLSIVWRRRFFDFTSPNWEPAGTQTGERDDNIILESVRTVPRFGRIPAVFRTIDIRRLLPQPHRTSHNRLFAARSSRESDLRKIHTSCALAHAHACLCVQNLLLNIDAPCTIKNVPHAQCAMRADASSSFCGVCVFVCVCVYRPWQS